MCDENTIKLKSKK